MERYLIENFGSNSHMREKAIDMLASRGGGTIVADGRHVVENEFGLHSDVDLLNLRDELRARGVDVTWRGAFIPEDGNVLALYPSSDLLSLLDGIEGIDMLVVLGWNPQETDAWCAEHHPKMIAGGNPIPPHARH